MILLDCDGFLWVVWDSVGFFVIVCDCFGLLWVL